ncbi:MAG TPA: glycosyltransferase [Candidatus Baltobacteraceae bacterium]|jgi:glycosyltransferase involved in cell wall biosynthesis|nr:glycosyltransferase [Candidatus Baltobacteraceae bacterium]
MFTECYRPIRNGVVASLEALCETLRECGHETVCVTPEMRGWKESDANVVRIPSLPLPSKTGYRLPIPLMVSKRVDRALAGTAIVHAHAPFVTGWMGLRFARRNQIPFVFSYHTQYDRYVHYVPFDARVTRRVALEIVQRFANSADAVIVPTPTIERRVRELGVSNRVVVIPTGIDVERFVRVAASARRRAFLGIEDDRCLLLWVGRLAREKNLELALETIASLNPSKFQLAVVGDGPERARLERYARDLGLDARVIFLGEQQPEVLPEIYASADGFLHTSLTETQGLVLVEALASGLPIIAVDAPQTRDVLAGSLDQTAWVAPPNVRDLASVLTARVSELRRDAPSGWSRAAAFDRRTLGGRILDLYRELRSLRGLIDSTA